MLMCVTTYFRYQDLFFLNRVQLATYARLRHCWIRPFLTINAGNQITLRSQIVFLVHLNNALIFCWTSQKANSSWTIIVCEQLYGKETRNIVHGRFHVQKKSKWDTSECICIYLQWQLICFSKLRAFHFQLKKTSKYVAFHHVYKGSTLTKWGTNYINI